MLDTLELLTIVFNGYVCIQFCLHRIFEDTITTEEERYDYIMVYIVIPIFAVVSLMSIYRHVIGNLITRGLIQ